MIAKKRIRPVIPEYAIETSEEGMLSWKFVVENMADLKNYWVCTTYPDGRPHSTPVWGSWIDNHFYFGGGPITRKAKNLARNPNIVIHTENGDNVVIVEGKIALEDDGERIKKIRAGYERKYKMDHPPPFWRVDPSKILARTMDEYVKSPTKWVMEE